MLKYNIMNGGASVISEFVIVFSVGGNSMDSARQSRYIVFVRTADFS
jgi:hypothetical protein